jgi:serine/threonine protein kinase
MPPIDQSDRTVIAPTSVSAPPPPSSGDTLLLGTKLGEFEVTGLIGQGGFGIVYSAYDHSLQRKVALKEYMPSALAARSGAVTVSVRSDRHADTFAAGLKSFINEARLLAQFDHPSLVKVYRFWEANGTAYMVMPFYEGATLKDALRDLGGPPDEAWLKGLLHPLLEALAVLHHEQCFHRDIAPDNILILNDGRPLLLDFGAARRVIGDMTQALTVILKPGYAPVEQYAEMPDMKQGAWTDIYALASVIYFAATGKPPVASVARMMTDPLQPLSTVAAGRYSAGFLQGVDKALAVKPNDRPQKVEELRELWGLAPQQKHSHSATPTLATELANLNASASSPSPSKSGSPHVQRLAASPPSGHKHPFALYAIGGVVLVAIAAAGWFIYNRDKKLEAELQAFESQTSRKQAPAEDSSSQSITAVPSPTQEQASAPSPSPRVNDKPFSPGHMLDEIFEGRNREHAVTASVEKAQVRIGRDSLRFNISSSKPGHVYVLVIGTNRSDFYLLFPNAVQKDNRIDPGQSLKLPSSKWPMTAHGPAGTNEFVAIVSEEPRDFGELQPAPEDIFKKFPLDLGAKLYRDYSGTSPLFAGKAVCASGAQCSDSYGATIFSIEEID